MTTFYIINVLLFVAPVLLTLYLTFRDRIKRPSFVVLFSAIGLYVVCSYLGSLLALQFESTPISHILIFTISILLGTMIFYSAVSYRFSQSLFVISIIKCYVDDVSLTSFALFFAVKGYLPSSFAKFPVWPVFFTVLITFPLILLFYKKLLRPALDESEPFSFWSHLWFVPMCSNLLYALCLSPSFSEHASIPGLEFYFIPLLWTLLSFVSFIILLHMVTESTRSAALKAQLEVVEFQVHAQRREVDSMQQHVEYTRRVRHDLRHHLLTLQALLEQKDYPRIHQYVEEYTRRTNLSAPTVYTENPVLNAIFSHYHELANSSGIDADFTVAPEKELPVSDTDLCVILGNLLENAVEACRCQTSGKRFIMLKMVLKTPSVLVLMVENSYEGSIRKQGDTFLSSKQKGRRGIGIASVRHLAKKYRGVCKVEYTRDIFKVMLFFNQQAAD